MDPAVETPTDEELGLFALTVWKYKEGQLVSLMMHLGDELGLFDALAGAGPTTSTELAERTGHAERWVREWLLGVAAAGLVDTDDGEEFTMSPAAVEVLTDDTSLWHAGGALSPPHADDIVDGVKEAFRSGIGMPYDRLGPRGAHQMERMSGPWTRQALVPRVIPLVDGLAERLEAGATVADVGCGAGGALLELAAAYPASTFRGYDPSEHAVSRARSNAEERGLDNVAFLQETAAGLPADHSVDLVLTFDCLHDMTNPVATLQAIRDAIADDGVLLVKEIRCADTFQENLKNPVLALMYGFSLTACMSSATSEPGGAGLGTVGLPPSKLRAMTEEAGFTGGFETHDIGEPTNLYHEVRP